MTDEKWEPDPSLPTEIQAKQIVEKANEGRPDRPLELVKGSVRPRRVRRNERDQV